MSLESSTFLNETTEIGKELKGKDSDTVAEFLNRRLAELEEQRNEEEAKLVGPNESGWGILPDLILEKIFCYLSIRQRYYASCACQQWYQAFHFKKPWQTFLMADDTLCRRRYDYGERAYRHVLDHHRTHQLITHVGNYLRNLTIIPKSFFGLFAHYHFMNHISTYSERFDADPESVQGCEFKIQSFRFIFFCDIATENTRTADHWVIGTGGDILGSLKRCIGNLKHLRRLDLIDLLLVPEDAIHLLDEACSALCEKLKTLTLINGTKDHFTFLHPACFINLRVLYISPQNLGEEMIDMLANSLKLKELHIVQNSYTGIAVPVDPRCWFRVNHLFKIYLRTSSSVDKEILWQERANVVSVLYDCPITKFSVSAAATVIDLYSDCIKEYGHFGLPKFSSSRKFVNRIDATLLSICRKCPYLTTLYVRDRISTSTALLIVSMSPNLRHFYVRRNALLKKIDFMFHFNLYLDFNFTQWIKMNAKSYERSTREIAKILGNFSWKPMSDKDFKMVCSNRPPY